MTTVRDPLNTGYNGSIEVKRFAVSAVDVRQFTAISVELSTISCRRRVFCPFIKRSKKYVADDAYR